MSNSDVQAVRAALQKFQDGYQRRDPDLIDDFKSLFVEDGGLEVIGTGGVFPGDEEWCQDVDAACKLFVNDWEAWGDLELDVTDARINALGDVAWLSTTGTVEMTLDPEDATKDYLDYIREIASEEDSDPREQLLEILRGGTNTLFEVERGEQYIWPLRFTAVLIRRADAWLFHQVQFSFATTRFPDVRNVP